MNQFIKEDLENVIKVKCPQTLDLAASQEFLNLAKAWMLSTANAIVMDFSAVETLSKDFYKAVIQFKTILKNDSKIFCTLNLSPLLLKQIKADGVELAFHPIQSIQEVMAKKTAQAAPAINVAFISPFFRAMQKTIEVQCKTKVKILPPYVKKEQITGIAIAGVLTLMSNGSSGSLVLGFPEPVFLKIYENMFEEKHQKITTDLEDAAGELLNIVYGVAKAELNEKGFHFEKVLPTVLVGEKLRFRRQGAVPTIILPFEIENGILHLEIEFNPNGESKNV